MMRETFSILSSLNNHPIVQIENFQAKTYTFYRNNSVHYEYYSIEKRYNYVHAWYRFSIQLDFDQNKKDLYSDF